MFIFFVVLLCIVLVGDYDLYIIVYWVIFLVLCLVGEVFGLEIVFDWLVSDCLFVELVLECYDGFWCVLGSFYCDVDVVLCLIVYVWGWCWLFFGICVGFQYMIFEFVCNVFGWQVVIYGEEYLYSDQVVIVVLFCVLFEVCEEVCLLCGLCLVLVYVVDWIEVDYYCCYVIVLCFVVEFIGGVLWVSVWSVDGVICVVELEQYLFFVVILF